MTDREAYIAVMASGPLLRGDAIVVFTGQDDEPAIEVAVELMRQTAADELVLTGWATDPARRKLLGKGVAPSRITTEYAVGLPEAAWWVASTARRRGWKRILVPTSPYRQYRTHLLTVSTLRSMGLGEELQVTMVPGDAPWHEVPEGQQDSRLDLLRAELGFVDSLDAWSDGLAYLQHWGSK